MLYSAVHIYSVVFLALYLKKVSSRGQYLISSHTTVSSLQQAGKYKDPYSYCFSHIYNKLDLFCSLIYLIDYTDLYLPCLYTISF